MKRLVDIGVGLVSLALAGSVYSEDVSVKGNIESYVEEKNVERKTTKTKSSSMKIQILNSIFGGSDTEHDKYIQKSFYELRKKEKDSLDSLEEFKNSLGQEKWDSISKTYTERKPHRTGSEILSPFSRFEKDWIDFPLGPRLMVNDIYSHTDKFVEKRMSEEMREKFLKFESEYLRKINTSSQDEINVMNNEVRKGLIWGDSVDITNSESFNRAEMVGYFLRTTSGLETDIVRDYAQSQDTKIVIQKSKEKKQEKPKAKTKPTYLTRKQTEEVSEGLTIQMIELFKAFVNP